MVGPGGLNGTCGKLYPARMRTSGLGWAIGIGRIGSVVAPMLGGYLLSIGLPPTQIAGRRDGDRPACAARGTGRRSPRLGTAITGMGPARVKTCARQGSVEPFSLLPSSDSRRQYFWFSDWPN